MLLLCRLIDPAAGDAISDFKLLTLLSPQAARLTPLCPASPLSSLCLFLLADYSASLNLERSALARKRFTLQGLSNRRAPPKDPESKERDVTRRFSLASSISTTTNTSALTKGPLVPAVKVKRHEIKSDPTPLGFEDAFERNLLAQAKCSAVRSTRPVPRSASQTGWPSRQMPSLDTFEDFEAIPSSAEELSNSSDMEEESQPNNGSNLYRVEGSFDTCFPDSLTLEDGDLVQFIQEGEDGQWLVKKLVSEKTDWVPSSLLQPADGDTSNIRNISNTGACKWTYG
ncbi:uncharacterized protein LOC117046392 [Lacerta agilis]|uniref:uncharacterized protein LOC117046392 n=1 Tax=Lacerta agilis TaxID=80427 RepID=UPI00141A2D1F|nr:uncharacterized protein LOC117046392 [Lacerta agilis]